VTIEPTSDILPHLPPPPYRRGRIEEGVRGRIEEGVVPFVSKHLRIPRRGQRSCRQKVIHKKPCIMPDTY